jgi:hypothetical protein
MRRGKVTAYYANGPKTERKIWIKTARREIELQSQYSYVRYTRDQGRTRGDNSYLMYMEGVLGFFAAPWAPDLSNEEAVAEFWAAVSDIASGIYRQEILAERYMLLSRKFTRPRKYFTGETRTEA